MLLLKESKGAQKVGKMSKGLLGFKGWPLRRRGVPMDSWADGHVFWLRDRFLPALLCLHTSQPSGHGFSGGLILLQNSCVFLPLLW